MHGNRKADESEAYMQAGSSKLAAIAMAAAARVANCYDLTVRRSVLPSVRPRNRNTEDFLGGILRQQHATHCRDIPNTIIYTQVCCVLRHFSIHIPIRIQSLL